MSCISKYEKCCSDLSISIFKKMYKFRILQKKSYLFFRCTVGDFVTEGEGNGKRTSKARAAELMLDKLRELPPLGMDSFIEKKKLRGRIRNSFI